MLSKLSQIKGFFRADFVLNTHQLFTLFVLFWIGLGWLGLILALLGIFYTFILVIYILLGGATLLYLTVFNLDSIRVNYRFFLILLSSLTAIFIFSYYSAPTIFSGRDQGSLSEAAIHLAQNHQLEFSFPAVKEFFKIYGPGQALNFPGFSYTENGTLISQFSLGYISWLAIFYSIFGLNGLIIANAVTFLIFLFSFYLTARNFLRPESALVAYFLILTSFVFSWFFKFTLSENLALGLLWFGVYEFVLFIQQKTDEVDANRKKQPGRFHLMASFLAFGLLSFARVEAVAFLIIAGFILFARHRNWKYLAFAVLGKKLLLLLGVIALVHFFTVAVNSQIYFNIFKGLLGSFISQKNDFAISGNFLDSLFYTARVFWVYHLFLFIAIGIVALFYLRKQKNIVLLAPFLIILPNFIYLLNPSVSADHPWMLRRFVFGVIPACVLYSVWFWDYSIKKRLYFYLLTGLLLVSNLSILIPFLTVSPGKNLLPQIKELSDNFQNNDLVLVDREATGDGWQMMTGPMNFLFEKQAVYFFNPNDLIKINLANFQDVYLIIPDNSLGLYKDNDLFNDLTPIKEYRITNTAFGANSIDKVKAYASPVILPTVRNIAVDGKIYLYRK